MELFVLSSRWFILSVIFLARISMGYQFQSIGSVSPSLIKDFAIEYAAIGTLIGLQSLPGLFLSLPSGILGNRFGDKRITLWGLVLMTIGTVWVGISHSFPVAATGRLISGIGAILMNVLMTKMVADWFAGKEIITAMAIFVNSWPVGIGLALVTQPAISLTLNWAAVFHISAAASAAGFVLMAIFYHPPDEAKQIATGPKSKVPLLGREIYLVTLAAIIWAFYNGAYIIVPTFGPPLLSSKGMLFPDAAVLVSLSNWLIIGSVPLGGWMAQKFRRPNTFMTLGFILFGLAMLLLPFGSAIPLIISMGIIGGIPAGSIMAMPAAVLRPESRAVGMGLFWTIYYGVYASLPALAGLGLDFTKSTASPLFFGAGLLFLATILLIWFRLIQKPLRVKGE
jgi:predicted MFS family arabinose efflux permease